MTGTPKYRPPKTNAEWARTVERRLVAGENPNVVRIGAWTLSVDGNGNLIGSNVNGGSVVIAEPPEVTNSVDVVVTGELYMMKAARAVSQAQGLITWDTVVYEQGEWGIDVGVPFADIVIPRTAKYQITADIHCATRIDDERQGFVLVNGVAVMSCEADGNITGSTASASGHNHGSGSLNITWEPIMLMVGTFALNQGDVVRVTTTNTGNIGPSTVNPVVLTTLSISEWA